MEEPTVAEGLMSVARAIRNLGNADASTPMGGLEAHGAVIKEVGDQIVEAAAGIATAITELAIAMDGVANAIRETKQPDRIKKPKCVCGGEENVVGCIPSCPAYTKKRNQEPCYCCGPRYDHKAGQCQEAMRVKRLNDERA